MALTNIFEVAVNDQSLFYLGRIFGNVGDVLGGTGPALLGAVFRVFNTAVLALGAIVVVYTTVIGVLATAHEGTFLGAKWHKMWTPFRMVVGIGGLVPTKTGYCVVQIAMMWLIIQGVGAADAVWTAAVEYFKQGGPISTAGAFTTSLGTYTDMKELFQGLTCQAAAKNANISGSYCSANPTEGFCTQQDSDMWNTSGKQVSQGMYKMGPGGACGYLDLGSTSQATSGDADQAAKAAQYQSYTAIIPSLGQIAELLVDATYTYNNSNPLPQWAQSYCNDNGITTCTKDGLNLSNSDLVNKVIWPYYLYPYLGSNFLRVNVNLYLGNVLNATTKSSQGAAVTMGGYDSTKLLNQSEANGWILAGSYYYLIATMNNKAQSGTANYLQLWSNSSNPTAVQNRPTTQYANKSLPGNADTYYDLAGTLAQTIMSAQTTGGGEGKFGGNVGGASTAGGAWYEVGWYYITQLGNEIISGWMQTLTIGAAGYNGVGSQGYTSGGQIGVESNQAIMGPQVNPIVPLQSFGEAMLLGIQIVFAILIIVIFAVQEGASVMSSVNSTGYALYTVFTFLMTPIMFLLGSFFIFSATLAIYVPMIPYIIFTFTSVGWFIGVLETMIAGPIVALGILHPGGQEILGKADPAVMLLLNMFLRPTLMIIGMLSGMLLSYVIVTLINSAFLGVVKQVNPVPGLVELAMFMAIYTSMIITSLNKCFDMIRLVPDQTLRWIGQAHQFGETGPMEQQVAGAAKQMAGEAKGAMEKAPDTATKSHDARKAALDDKKTKGTMSP